MIKFPDHLASLHLTHNQHKDYYETVEKYNQNSWMKDISWVSEEQQKKSLETNEVWELQWYPHTPIGSYCIAGADLDAVLEYALEVEKEYKADE